MEAETQLAKLIRATNDKARYDRQVKKLLSNKAILAWILKTCTEEFAQYSTQEIMKYIQGDPEISTKAVHQNDADTDEMPLDSDISLGGISTEDSNLREGTVFYDVRFSACVPDDNAPVQVIINIEAQLDTSPGYPVEKRAVYYCCRLISAQYGTVFSHSEYQKLRKVYSIWICPDPAKKRQNTIKKISLGETAVFGKVDTSGRDSDLMQAVIVNLGEPDKPVDNQLLRLMNVLLSAQTDVREKQRVMREEFNIAMTTELKSEVESLCNLSQGIYNEGIERGIETGRIKGAVEMLRDEGYGEAQIVDRIMKKFGLTLEDAERYVTVQTGI